MSDTFADLSTVQFSARMRPALGALLEGLWPKSTYTELSQDESPAHALDKHLGIDGILKLPKSGAKLTVQTKVRSHAALQYGDFTVETRNGNQTDGEFGTLAAQLYIYCWASADERSIERYLVVDVARLKMMIEQRGGLAAVGMLQENARYGSSSFYCLDLADIDDSVLYSNVPMLMAQPRAA